MKAKLSIKETFLIGSMLFGLFFGAGNIIFPLMLGQQAGNQYIPAAIGFIITAVGLPLLGVNALGTTKNENLYDLASHINPLFGKIFTLILYFTIGPLFAIPRLATTSFEVGVKPLINSGSEILFLLGFSALFFLFVWYFSLKPGEIIDIIGKYINPSFLLLIGILIIVAFINPMGSTDLQVPQGPYITRPFF